MLNLLPVAVDRCREAVAGLYSHVFVSHGLGNRDDNNGEEMGGAEDLGAYLIEMI